MILRSFEFERFSILNIRLGEKKILRNSSESARSVGEATEKATNKGKITLSRKSRMHVSHVPEEYVLPAGSVVAQFAAEHRW